MITRIASGVLLLAAMFAGVAGAQPSFADNATVTITPALAKGGGSVFVLEKTGEDGNKDGVFRLRQKSTGSYLSAKKADEGAMVGWSEVNKPSDKGSEWILHKNKAGWSIIAKANGANTVARGKSASGLLLQRNQGTPDQMWEIK